ncbi:hypothetical protein ASG37_01670 [Sphingomonas sp. Leaf407]|nr:hypothetical protein ASE97_01695 [Sphingomonas sp. Leaf42]KQT29880.1 hypothetical protein ASG37_01670 [Sphingomonas sp. Leaf407]
MYGWLLASMLVLPGGCQQSGPPSTPLFAGIEGMAYRRGEAMIRDRIEARQMRGSPERALIAYLETQGLQIDPNRKSASVKFGGPLCGSRVRIDWETERTGEIATMFVLYADTGCL